MATYKLIQDIEAEDHILGPLSFRQFVFALIAVFCYYICFILITKHVAFLLVMFLPPALFFTFFAFPFGRDQPTEVWALAKIRFLFKPRRRTWDQSGVKELVTITVPKKVEVVLTNGLSQTEVKSRLEALANTIDSRGWAVKNVDVNTYAPPNMSAQSSDRLVDVSRMPQEVPSYQVQASDDILDEVSNPIARQFDNMISQSNQEHRQHIIDQMNGIRQQGAAGATAVAPGAGGQEPAAAMWFMNQAQNSGLQSVQPQAASPLQLPAPVAAGPVAANPTPDDTALVQQLQSQNQSRQAAYGNMHTLQPLQDQPVAAPIATPQTVNTSVSTSGVPAPDPAILSLASNNDLNVATLAREADKAARGEKSLHDGEVVISLR